MKRIIGGIISFLLLISVVSAGDLLAGQNMDVGNVNIWNDATTLYVVYEIEDMDWAITQTHLSVECSSKEVPQTEPNKKGNGGGNPIPGHFEYSMEHDPAVTEYTYEIPLSDFDCSNPVVAAHAVVEKEYIVEEWVTVEVTEEYFTPWYADTVIDYNQGTKKNGDPVDAIRSVPEQGLMFETGQDPSNFFSLGFGGYLEAEFACPLYNGEGDDIRLIEDTWGSYPLEKADVYLSQDGLTWTLIGTADNTVRDTVYNIHTVTSFDITGNEGARFIRIVDTSDLAVHGATADGYDLNAIEALQDCTYTYEIEELQDVTHIQDETAWCFDSEENQFPGSNWATYCQYEMEKVCVDFASLEGLNPGDSVEGLGAVHPNLNIDAIGNAIAIFQGVGPILYGAPNGPGSISNGGIDVTGGISDDITENAGKAHFYTFDFDGITVSEFSVRMLDFGDYNPTRSKYHYAKMTGYDSLSSIVDDDELEYHSDGLVNPRVSNFGDLYITGDFVTALEGEPGNWIWKVSGEGISSVDLFFGLGHDPKMALDLICFVPE